MRKTQKQDQPKSYSVPFADIRLIPFFSTWLFVSLASMAISAQPAEFLYSIDDGSSEGSFGIAGNGDFMWGNYFTEKGVGLSVGRLRVSFGDVGVAAGTPFQIAVYDDLDNDGDPSTNLHLLAMDTGVVIYPEPIGIDTFQTVNFRDVIIDGGFFVAVLFSGLPDSRPAKIDQSSSLGRSWIATNDVVGGLDIENPFGSATNFGLIDDFTTPGNFLVRADGFFCLKGDVNRDGVVNLLDVFPFVELVVNQTFQCEGDINL